jgi:glycosyltransferase involved in cell wall biosynthesis
MYHKVDLEKKSKWYVTAERFYRQMVELAYKKVVYLNDYDPSDTEQVVITFDGVYANVMQFALPILRNFGYPFELFVTGNYIGKDNSFDVPEPLEMFANEDELKKLIAGGGRLQWHTKTHRRFDKNLSLLDIADELEIPDNIRALDSTGFKWFAYPHGDLTDDKVALVREKFDGALSCVQGDSTDRYKLNRVTAYDETSFAKEKISVIVASYNYGRFLPEAIESVLNQTRMPDEILITDDCSSDDTFEIAQMYQNMYPDSIRINRNETNLGIVDNFNRSMSLLKHKGYVCFLGADNRFRSNYLELCAGALDKNPNAVIAYTDFALFGDRAGKVYEGFAPKKRGEIINNSVYIINFYTFDPSASNRDDELKKSYTSNIHGSSMYRRSAFDAIGGYKKTNKAEDMDLFTRMLTKIPNAIPAHIPIPILEYRQHSDLQANIVLNEVNALRNKVAILKLTLAKNSQELELLRRENQRLKRLIGERGINVDFL